MSSSNPALPGRAPLGSHFPNPAVRAVVRLVARLAAAFARWREQARQQAQFACLTERDLNDLGVCRSEYSPCVHEAEGRITSTRRRLWYAGSIEDPRAARHRARL